MMGKIVLLLALFVSCKLKHTDPTQIVTTEDGFIQNPFDQPSSIFSSASTFNLEVAYETGAEPFVGTTNSGMNYWNIVEDNLKGIFNIRSKPMTVHVPKSLSDMSNIGAQNKTTWTVDDLYNLSLANRKYLSTSSNTNLWIVFLKGNLANDDGTPNTSTIGVSLSGTTIIAIFKDVIYNSGANPNGPVPKYVEQSTLVHEIGHVLGLVNNGIPLTSAHEDSTHVHHCNNPNCVMYWANEGATDLKNFVSQYILSGSNLMFGNECLNDIKLFNP